MTYKDFLNILKIRFDYTSKPIGLYRSEKLQDYQVDVADIRKNRRYYGRISIWVRGTQKYNPENKILLVNLVKPHYIDRKFIDKIDFLNWRATMDEDTLRPVCKEKIEAMRPSNPYPRSWNNNGL